MGSAMSPAGTCFELSPNLSIALLSPIREVNRLTKTGAGNYIQVIITYLASLEIIRATSSHHSGTIST
jgi:hypothetical protein